MPGLTPRSEREDAESNEKLKLKRRRPVCPTLV